MGGVAQAWAHAGGGMQSAAIGMSSTNMDLHERRRFQYTQYHAATDPQESCVFAVNVPVCPVHVRASVTRVCPGLSFQETPRATGRPHDGGTRTSQVRRARSPTLHDLRGKAP